jgi:hypothetical protein
VCKITTNCRNIISQEHQDYSNRTPQGHQEFLQSFISIIEKSGYNMGAILQERNGGRERESEEKIGQHGVAMKFDLKNEKRGLSFIGGREERPPLHALHMSLPKEGGSLKGRGRPHERGELPLEKETQKWRKKPPILSLKLSLMPQGIT